MGESVRIKVVRVGESIFVAMENEVWHDKVGVCWDGIAMYFNILCKCSGHDWNALVQPSIVLKGAEYEKDVSLFHLSDSLMQLSRYFMLARS